MVILSLLVLAILEKPFLDPEIQMKLLNVNLQKKFTQNSVKLTLYGRLAIIQIQGKYLLNKFIPIMSQLIAVMFILGSYP